MMITEADIQAFSKAVMYGDFEKVKAMIAADAAIVNAQDGWGFSALHNVMSEEQFEIVAYLIANGANVDIQNEDGIAPLHLACYPENAQLLLDAGADIDLRDTQGHTPLHILASDGEERYEVIEYLLSRGADRSLTDHYGKTPGDVARMREDRRNAALLS